MALANSEGALSLLREFFSPHDALRIYAVALVHFVQGFTYMRDVASFYEMSVLRLRLPGLRLGYAALSRLYEDLGRRQKPVRAFEQALVDRCSGHPSTKMGQIHLAGAPADAGGVAEREPFRHAAAEPEGRLGPLADASRALAPEAGLATLIWTPPSET